MSVEHIDGYLSAPIFLLNLFYTSQNYYSYSKPPRCVINIESKPMFQWPLHRTKNKGSRQAPPTKQREERLRERHVIAQKGRAEGNNNERRGGFISFLLQRATIKVKLWR